VSVRLDTGAQSSFVDADFLLQYFPTVTVKTYAFPWSARGVGGGKLPINGYCVLDICIPAKIKDLQVHAKITHQFNVIHDKPTEMLIGQDFILHNGVIINSAWGQATFSTCGNAQTVLSQSSCCIPQHIEEEVQSAEN
jgi:hypothetical protein